MWENAEHKNSEYGQILRSDNPYIFSLNLFTKVVNFEFCKMLYEVKIYYQKNHSPD